MQIWARKGLIMWKKQIKNLEKKITFSIYSVLQEKYTVKSISWNGHGGLVFLLIIF